MWGGDYAKAQGEAARLRLAMGGPTVLVQHVWTLGLPMIKQLQGHVGITGGPSPRSRYATPPPPPPSGPPGPLSYQGSMATDHTYGGAEGARKIFFSFPLPT